MYIYVYNICYYIRGRGTVVFTPLFLSLSPFFLFHPFFFFSLSLSLCFPFYFCLVSRLPLVHSVKRTTREAAVFESAKELLFIGLLFMFFSNVSDYTTMSTIETYAVVYLILSFPSFLSFFFSLSLPLSILLFLRVLPFDRNEKVAFSAVSTRCCSCRGNDASNCCRRPRGS